MSLPQAFPSAWGNPEQGGDHVPGMTLRDYFAGQVIVGLIANPQNRDVEGGRVFAQTAYQMAEAMLAERDK